MSFNVTNIPAPPKGINEGTPPPPPQTLASTPIRVADVSSNNAKWGSWFSALFSMILSGHGGQEAEDNFKMLQASIDAGNLNIDTDIWQWAIQFVESEPPFNTVVLRAIASWDQIYEVYNQGNSSTHKQDVTVGVTTTDQETQTFGVKVGVNVSAGWGPISASMSSEFSEETGSSHSISFTSQITTTDSFHLPEQSFVQIWQLTMQIVADHGPSLAEQMPIYQSLTYPPDARLKEARAMSKESIEARAQEMAKEMAEKVAARLKAAR